jgi:hypothetical protein
MPRRFGERQTQRSRNRRKTPDHQSRRRHNLESGIMPQIAERMGRSVPSVASLLRRGLEHLRKQLKVEPP